MAVAGVLFASAAAAAAALLVLTAAAADAALTTSCRSTLFLYQPECEWNYVNTSFASCKCTDTPCGFYRYKFIRNATDKHRAYLYRWTGCRGRVTLVKHTTSKCNIFYFRSVKICMPCVNADKQLGAEGEEEEECAGTTPIDEEY